MARVKNIEQALETFKATEGNSFFSLKNDKDIATVRLLYNTKEELDIYVVHEVMVNGKKRWVECLQGDCPLCKSGNRPALKLFLQLYDYTDKKVKTWERGQKSIPDILALFNRYGGGGKRRFEIERHGKKGDTATTYQFFALDSTEKTTFDTVEEFMEKAGVQKQELEGSFILTPNAEDMTKLINGEPVGSQSTNSSPSTENLERREYEEDPEEVF